MTLNGAYSWTRRREHPRPPRLRPHSRRAGLSARGTIRRRRARREQASTRARPNRCGVSNGGAGSPPSAVTFRAMATSGHFVQRLGTTSAAFSRPNWHDHLDTQGSRDMARLNAFIRSITWYELVPSGLNGMRTLVTAGGSSESSSDYVAAAATFDGTLLVAYIPPAHRGANHRGYDRHGWSIAGALVRSDKRRVPGDCHGTAQHRRACIHPTGQQQCW